MRTLEQELRLRRQQREKYFEDPQYRKWSDITQRPASYAEYSELGFIASYLVGDCDVYVNLSRFRELLENGKQLPINWKSVYNYYYERYDDDNNRLWEEFYHGLCDASDVHGQSLASLLSEFQDKLIDDYDMI